MRANLSDDFEVRNWNRNIMGRPNIIAAALVNAGVVSGVGGADSTSLAPDSNLDRAAFVKIMTGIDQKNLVTR